jgi:putative flippase GtrA
MPDRDSISRRHSLWRFGTATAITLAASFGLTILLHELLGTSEELAYAVALVVVFLTSFAFLRWYIYGRRTGPIVAQFCWYSLSALGFRGSEYLTFLVLHTWLDTPYILAMLVIQGASFVAKFLYYGAVVFRRPRTPDATPIAETPGTGPEPPTP